MKRFENNSVLGGIRVVRGAPIISHMLFADDSYIFCKATKEEANRVKHMLSIFERASGQKMNQHKSSVFFSRNVMNHCKQEICNTLQYAEAKEGSHYLGLPTFM